MNIFLRFIPEPIEKFHQNIFTEADATTGIPYKEALSIVLTSHNVQYQGCFYAYIVYRDGRTFTWREVPEWAHQSSSTGHLSKKEFQKINQIMRISKQIVSTEDAIMQSEKIFIVTTFENDAVKTLYFCDKKMPPPIKKMQKIIQLSFDDIIQKIQHDGKMGPGGNINMNKNEKLVIEAKTILLNFKNQKDQELEKAIGILYKFEKPEHFEEWGMIDNKNYFYAKDIYKNAGIIIHQYDNKITNVEKY